MLVKATRGREFHEKEINNRRCSKAGEHVSHSACSFSPVEARRAVRRMLEWRRLAVSRVCPLCLTRSSYDEPCSWQAATWHSFESPGVIANGKDAIYQFGALSSALNYLFGGIDWKAIALIQFSWYSAVCKQMGARYCRVVEWTSQQIMIVLVCTAFLQEVLRWTL